MVLSDKSDYDGWNIEAFCNETKPSDWAPGDPIPYAANLIAVLKRPQQFPPGWSGAKRFTIPEHGTREFSDWTEAYRALKREAHERIDGMKRQ